MSGAAIVTYLLSQDSTLTATVSASNIRAGKVSNTPDLPAISVYKITANPENTLKMAESTYAIQERVQVSVFASSEGSAKSIMALVRGALSATPGTVDSMICQSILPSQEGPDLFDETSRIAQQTQDFLVWFVR